MSLSRREQTLATATVLVGLFAIIGFTARPQLDKYREERDRAQRMSLELNELRQLVKMGGAWKDRYETVRDQMPVFEMSRQVDTYWLSRMDAIANEHSVRILKRDVGREELIGDVYEFTIKCGEWEGTLDAFVKFLFAMQQEGAMLDVRELNLRPHPSKVKGMLKGSFSLYCAYMRGESPSPATPGSTAADAAAGAPALNAAGGATSPTESNDANKTGYEK